MRRSGKLSTLDEALEALLARREGRARVKERLAALVWRECVGGYYADHTKVTRVRRGTMYVWCSSPALAHQLSMDAQEIIRRINAELAGNYIKQIRPTTTGRRLDEQEAEPELGPPTRRGPSGGELEAIRLSAAEMKTIDREAESIEDESLREKFRTAAISNRRARKWRQAHGHGTCRQCGWVSPPPLRRCTKCGREL